LTRRPKTFRAARRAWAIAALALATGAPAWAAADGATLVGDVWARYRTVKSEREESEILVVTTPQAAPFSRTDAETLLRGAQSGVVHKRAVRHVLYGQERQDKLHILFSLPAEDAGLGLLVWRRPDAGQDEMWLYMPGYHRVRRIPASSDQKLAGTDLIYEDVRELTGERTDAFAYSAPTSEQVNGRPADVVIATPKDGAASAYSRRKMWIDKEWLFPVQVEFSDTQGRLWKIMRNSEIHEVAPNVRRADLIEMRDVQRNQATVMLVIKRTVGLDIPAQVFTEDYLVHPGSD
jgi:hypothetical protein